MTICILDTSVFLNWLDVPGRNQRRAEVVGSLESYVEQGTSLLLPLAAIYETGNHIAQNDHLDGNGRRSLAGRFVQQVRGSFSGEAPWTATPRLLSGDMEQWLDEFPDCAMRGVGLVDLSIVKVYQRQCELNRGRRVFIWSYDQHLQGYDRPAGL